MSVSPIYSRVRNDCNERRKNNLFRSIPPYSVARSTIDLSTNSYLGLQTNSIVQHRAKELANQVYSGNLASRLVSQSSSLFDTLESEIASWKGTETALVFNSGYAANIGLLQALCTRNTEVFSDRLNHASIYDGIRLSGCKLIRYKHLDMSDLEKLVQTSAAQEKIIITDSVFSMDGDRAPLEDIITLAKKYSCFIIIDEAHATGVLGDNSAGLAEALGLNQHIDIIMGTMSKALAGCGGYVAVSTLLRDFLINTSRSFIYSTALPHVVLAHNLAAIQYVRSNPSAGKELQATAEHFRKVCHSAFFTCGQSTTQIIPLITESEQKALALKSYLAKNGINAPAIRPPTVPKGSARVRLSLHSALTATDIEKVISVLSQWNGSDE